MEAYLQVLEDGKVHRRNFDIDNFLYVLNPYYKGGEFDYLLNATENLDLLNQRLVIFEIDQCKDHPILFPVITIIIMEVFISKMRKLKGQRKVLLLEEVWKSIAKESMAVYIQYLFKTVRKFYGEAIVVTQEIEDMLKVQPLSKKLLSAMPTARYCSTRANTRTSLMRYRPYNTGPVNDQRKSTNIIYEQSQRSHQNL